MGVTTDFIGHVDVQPPLNDAEQGYLAAFAASRRCSRPGGPYEVPLNPAAAHDDTDIDCCNSVASGQPSLWCGWVPSWDGGSIAHDGQEKFYGAAEWLAYLIDHFLAPRGYAAESGLEWFSEFTFDHVVNGIIAASQHDTGELYLIRVDDNVVQRETLVGTSLGFGETVGPC